MRKKDILPWAFSFGLQSWSISASYSKSINPSINRSSNVRACCGQRSLWTIKTSDEALNLLTFPPVGFVMALPSQVNLMRHPGEGGKGCGSKSEFISRWRCDRGQGKVCRSHVHQANWSPTPDRQRGACDWHFIGGPLACLLGRGEHA